MFPEIRKSSSRRLRTISVNGTDRRMTPDPSSASPLRLRARRFAGAANVPSGLKRASRDAYSRSLPQTEARRGANDFDTPEDKDARDSSLRQRRREASPSAARCKISATPKRALLRSALAERAPHRLAPARAGNSRLTERGAKDGLRTPFPGHDVRRARAVMAEDVLAKAGKIWGEKRGAEPTTDAL
ncbi:hypothetical protein CCAX7_63250 [Capsulimonas corticalis]|uniref:Uncharacterized protein n=1 Tax=Capsulimonas corticalis TaxID=2219043 RepID=A0A402CWU1_9BACT|nr:hypothetical protein CCAX7_63250 [Capsulimonas corticalis]